MVCANFNHGYLQCVMCCLWRLVLAVYDVLTGKVVRNLEGGHKSCVRDISWHPYQHTIISSSVSVCVCVHTMLWERMKTQHCTVSYQYFEKKLWASQNVLLTIRRNLMSINNNQTALPFPSPHKIKNSCVTKMEILQSYRHTN